MLISLKLVHFSILNNIDFIDKPFQIMIYFFFFQIVEPFTAHYVFALGVARFLSCAHWVLQVLFHSVEIRVVI